MDNEQLQSLLRDTSCYGAERISITASNTLPKIDPATTENHLIISNTDPAHLGGRHWIVLRVGPKRGKATVVNYFDPLGECKMHGDFEKFISQFDLLISNKSFPVQQTRMYSDTCGMICAFASHLFCRGWQLADIMQVFDLSKTVDAGNFNECLVLQFMMKKFVKHATVFDKLSGCA